MSSRAKRIDKIMADCNAVGCPLLPGEDVADDDDECADDMCHRSTCSALSVCV